MLRTRIVLWLSVVAVVLVIGHVAGFYLASEYGLSRSAISTPLRQFDLNGEGNLAAWFQSFVILCCSLTAFVLASGTADRGAPARRWTVLGVALLLMAVDETAQIHDLATAPLRSIGLGHGPLYFAWVIPALVVLGVLAVYFAPLARSLPGSIRVRLVAAVAVYFGGAVGVEMIGGAARAAGRTDPAYLAVMTVEESLEIGGLLLALGTLLALVRAWQPQVTLRVTGAGSGTRVEAGPASTVSPTS